MIACGKILEIKRGRRCSLHFHKLKTKTFYLRMGLLKVRIKESAASEATDESVLHPGECSHPFAAPVHRSGRTERLGGLPTGLGDPIQAYANPCDNLPHPRR